MSQIYVFVSDNSPHYSDVQLLSKSTGKFQQPSMLQVKTWPLLAGFICWLNQVNFSTVPNQPFLSSLWIIPPRYRIVEFLKADQTCLQVCCSTLHENPNPSFSTNNGKIFLCSNRNRAKSVAFFDIPRIPSINARSKQLCPFIYDGLKEPA